MRVRVRVRVKVRVEVPGQIRPRMWFRDNVGLGIIRTVGSTVGLRARPQHH